MSAFQSIAILAGWAAWSILWAGALRFALASGFRRLGRSQFFAVLFAYAGMGVIWLVSLPLHQAMFGDAAMYGATPREAASFIYYLLAPFGFPLLFGTIVAMLLDAVRVLAVEAMSLFDGRGRA